MIFSLYYIKAYILNQILNLSEHWINIVFPAWCLFKQSKM